MRPRSRSGQRSGTDQHPHGGGAMAGEHGPKEKPQQFYLTRPSLTVVAMRPRSVWSTLSESAWMLRFELSTSVPAAIASILRPTAASQPPSSLQEEKPKRVKLTSNGATQLIEVVVNLALDLVVRLGRLELVPRAFGSARRGSSPRGGGVLGLARDTLLSLGDTLPRVVLDLAGPLALGLLLLVALQDPGLLGVALRGLVEGAVWVVGMAGSVADGV